MKVLTYSILIIAILIICGLIVNYSIESGKTEVYKWASEHNMEVKSIEVHITAINTPYYYVNKGSYIYEVSMTNGETWWCRTGIFGNDWEKDNGNNR